MLKSRLTKLWHQSWSMVLDQIGPQDIGGLIRTSEHTARLTARRAGLIVARVRLMAGLLAILTPLWILADLWIFAPEVWSALLPMRLITAFAFAAILLAVRRMHSLRDAYLALGYLMLVPTAFYLFVHFHLAGLQVGAHVTGYAAGYAYLPFLMIAMLAIFPLTVSEAAVFVVPMLMAQSIALFPGGYEQNWIAFATNGGALLLVATIAVTAGLSQLAFTMLMIREGIHDSLTGCYSQRCGEELLDLQFGWSSRANTRLAVVRIGLDNFQEMGRLFGHAAAEAALKNMTEILHDGVRTGDTMARYSGETLSLWSGDQFLLVLPHSTAAQATAVLQRLLTGGLGVRPDGAALTASMGIAERIVDAAEDWWKLVDLTSARLRAAQSAGGNRSVER